MVTAPIVASLTATVGTRALGVAGGLMADQALGDEPLQPHPVALFGSAMAELEAQWWDDSRMAGVRHAATGVLAGAGAGAVLGRSVAGVATATYISVASRALGDAAAVVGRALADGDLEAARRALPSLVGRDPTDLGASEIARAVVESVAENTVDAIVAPTVWAVLAGSPGALGYRAANTLDAMVGHHNERYERFGWASARLDDLANLAPARLTALLVAVCRPARARAVWQAVRDDAPAHPSPNAGVAEAAFAAALSIELGGANRYGDRTEHRGRLGRGRPVEASDIDRAIALSLAITRVLTATLATVGIVLTIASRRSVRSSA